MTQRPFLRCIAFRVPFEILCEVDDKKIITEIVKKINTTYNFGYLMLKELSKLGLITIEEKQGRSRKVFITEQGEVVQPHLLAIKRVLKEVEEVN